MGFPERLKAARLRHPLTQKQLGKILGVSIMTIRNWESGEKSPSMHAIIDLTRVFGISADELLGTKRSNLSDWPITSAESSLLKTYRSLDTHGRKVVDTICALELSRVEETAPKNRITRMIPFYLVPSAAGYSAPIEGSDYEMMEIDDSVPHGADFAVRIQGDSMAPYIEDGDIVYVKKQNELGVGDVGIFSIDGAMYCKLYYTDEERNLTLVSANPERKSSNVYVSADSASTVMCCGKVLLDAAIPFPDYFNEQD